MRRWHLLIVVLLSSLSGCTGPSQQMVSSTCPSPAQTPNASRVHLFVINGLDPIGFGGLKTGLCSNLQAQGYAVHFGEVWDQVAFKRQVTWIREADPQAKIALLGYSRGANIVRRMAQCLKGHANIDLLVYLGGDTIYDEERSTPANVQKIVNIRGKGFPLTGGPLMDGEDLVNADNYYLDVPHLKLPLIPETTGIMTRELQQLAASIHP